MSEQTNNIAAVLAGLEPTWHRGMYGCPDDMFARRDLRANLADALQAAGWVQRETCGGCQDMGSHRRHCPRHPDYHPLRVLADRAEGIGDSVGIPELANRAWSLGAALREAATERPYRHVCRTCGKVAQWPFCAHRDTPPSDGMPWSAPVRVTGRMSPQSRLRPGLLGPGGDA